jgi:hypothetical protein
MSAKRVYPKGDLRAVLAQRAEQRAERHPSRAERDIARKHASEIRAGATVTVTWEELKSGLWHAALANAHELHDMHNAGASEYLVLPDGTYEAV